MTNDEMKQIVIEAARKLQEAYAGKTFLRFPLYRERNSHEIAGTRVSEQEARIIFSDMLTRNSIYFAVEVPTQTTHVQKGEKEMSARYDMATYRNGVARDLDWVIELKAHNCREESIRKDLEKMVCAGLDCVWFHVLKNEDSGTFPTLLNKIDAMLKCEIVKHEGETQWIFAFVTLKKKKIYMKTVCLNDGEADSFIDIDKFDIISF